jgi:hypothetical protein
VQVEGRPAARQGDACACSGPPDAIAAGSPDVLIGDAAEAGAAGGARGGGASRLARASAAALNTLAPGPAPEDGHAIAARFTDPAGRPIVGVPYAIAEDDDGRADLLPGNGEVHRPAPSAEAEAEVRIAALLGAWWSTDEARPGDTVALTGEVLGIANGTAVRIAVQRLAAGTNEAVGAVEVRVAGGCIEARWTCAPLTSETESKEPGARDVEVYVAVVAADGVPQRVRTGPLRVVGSRLRPVSADGEAPGAPARRPFRMSA